MAIVKYLLYILLCVLSQKGYTQVVAVQADKMNILYLCVANPLTIAVEKTSSESLMVTTDNGEVRPDSYDGYGHYNIYPQHVGNAIIIVKKKIRGGWKLLDSVSFQVKRTPTPHTRFGGEKGGTMTKLNLCLQVAPEAGIGCGIEPKFRIGRFTVTVYRNGNEIFNRKIVDDMGARIDGITNAFFRQLENSDRVIFNEIAAKDCDGATRLLDPMEFTVTEADKFRKRTPGEIELIVDPITGNETIKKW